MAKPGFVKVNLTDTGKAKHAEILAKPEVIELTGYTLTFNFDGYVFDLILRCSVSSHRCVCLCHDQDTYVDSRYGVWLSLSSCHP